MSIVSQPKFKNYLLILYEYLDIGVASYVQPLVNATTKQDQQHVWHQLHHWISIEVA